jgi:hypothetical protein
MKNIEQIAELMAGPITIPPIEIDNSEEPEDSKEIAQWAGTNAQSTK